MGMKLDGPVATNALDSSGETLSIKGLDITDFIEGRAVANWEHSNTSEDGSVGRFVYAKKIFSASDCENERQLQFWNQLKHEFLYGVVELFDDEGHPGATAIAAMARYYIKKKDRLRIGLSIEGSTLERDGNNLKRAVARKAAITLTPCNKECWVDYFGGDSEMPMSKTETVEVDGFEDIDSKTDILLDIRLLSKAISETPEMQDLISRNGVILDEIFDDLLEKAFPSPKVEGEIAQVDGMVLQAVKHPKHGMICWNRKNDEREASQVKANKKQWIDNKFMDARHKQLMHGIIDNVLSSPLRSLRYTSDHEDKTLHDENQSLRLRHLKNMLSDHPDYKVEGRQDQGRHYIHIRAPRHDSRGGTTEWNIYGKSTIHTGRNSFSKGEESSNLVEGYRCFNLWGLDARMESYRWNPADRNDVQTVLRLCKSWGNLMDGSRRGRAKDDLRSFQDNLRLAKTLTAGMPSGAPSTLTGGAALQREHIDGYKKKFNQVRAAIRDWDKKRPLKDVVKAALPEVSDKYVEHFADLAHEIALKKGEVLVKATRVDPITNGFKFISKHIGTEQRALVTGLYIPDMDSISALPKEKFHNDIGESVFLQVCESPEKAVLPSNYYFLMTRFFGLEKFMQKTVSFEFAGHNFIAAENVGGAIPTKDIFNSVVDKLKMSGEWYNILISELILGQKRCRGPLNTLMAGDTLTLVDSTPFTPSKDVLKGHETDIPPTTTQQWLNLLDGQKLVYLMALLELPRNTIQTATQRLSIIKERASSLPLGEIAKLF